MQYKGHIFTSVRPYGMHTLTAMQRPDDLIHSLLELLNEITVCIKCEEPMLEAE